MVYPSASSYFGPSLLKGVFKGTKSAAKAAFRVKKTLEPAGMVRAGATFVPSSVGFHKNKPGATPYDTHKLVSEFAYINATTSEKGLKRRKKMLDDLKKQGYYIDRDLSGREQSVFFNPVTKKVIIGYRGTALDDASTRMKDLKSDFGILTGNTENDTRFKEADSVFKRVEQKYQAKNKHKFNIDVTGHSLGGALAKHVNDRHDNIDKNINFSRGSTPLRLQEGKENQYDVSNVWDPISLGARMEGGQQSKNYNPHFIVGSHTLGYL